MITQFFGEEIIKSLTKTGATTLQLEAGSRLRVGGLGVVLDSARNLDFGTTGLGGLDTGSIAASTLYYTYVVISGSQVGLVASISASGPSGFLVFREIGKVLTDTTPELYTPVNLGNLFKHYIHLFGLQTVTSQKVNWATINEDKGNGILPFTQGSGLEVTTPYDCDADITVSMSETANSSNAITRNSSSFAVGTSLALTSAAAASHWTRMETSWAGEAFQNDVFRFITNGTADLADSLNGFHMRAEAKYDDVV